MNSPIIATTGKPIVVYVCGHKNSDMDSIAAAYAFAWLLNYLYQREGARAVFALTGITLPESNIVFMPVRHGVMPGEAEYILSSSWVLYDARYPMQPQSVSPDQAVVAMEVVNGYRILVDHSEVSQQIPGTGEILGCVDHHVPNPNNLPPLLLYRACGSCSAQIAALFVAAHVRIPGYIAFMLVGGMQADTNMETSNYTKFDQHIQQLIHAQLGVRAKVYGRLMFKHAERGLHTKSTAELIGTEYKSYPGGVGVGAVKVVDSQKVLSRPDLVEGLQAKADQEGLLICMFMITPLDKPNSAFLVTNKYADLVCSALGDKAAMLDAEKIIELFFASRKGGLVGALPRIVDLIRKAQSSGEEGEV